MATMFNTAGLHQQILKSAHSNNVGLASCLRDHLLPLFETILHVSACTSDMTFLHKTFLQTIWILLVAPLLVLVRTTQA